MLKRLKFVGACLTVAAVSMSLMACGGGSGDLVGSDGGGAGGAVPAFWDQFDWDEAQWE